MGIEYPCGREAVMQVLPHREPFLWLTRVLECQPGRFVVAELDVDPALPLFAGHFPQHPVLPGVIVMEALAQAASFCELVAREGDSREGGGSEGDSREGEGDAREGDAREGEGARGAREVQGRIGFLVGIDGAKFRRQVRPSETLRLEACIVKRSSRLCVAEVSASVDGEICATATQKYVLASPSSGQGR